ncbi:MAG TPA: SGNH/GDSL hydrolase family protein [Polyangiaceae bacterium]
MIAHSRAGCTKRALATLAFALSIGAACSAPPQGGTGGSAGTGSGPPPTASQCFADDYVNPGAVPRVNYDQFNPTVGRHCNGTNHQDIAGVERVVFLGDSITVGTPPTAVPDFYRARLAVALAQKFGIRAPDEIWKNLDVVNGTSLSRSSGAFASCAEWGARTDDFIKNGGQIELCFPDSERSKRTLVIITMGGNDIASIAKKGATMAPPYTELFAQTEQFVTYMRNAVNWLKEPGRFPNGVFIVFGNNYEFTDGTADTSSCPAASLAGLGTPWQDTNALRNILIRSNEQYLRIAAETRTDMLFMAEAFCGHGFKSTDPSAPCYRGPNQLNWFDLTCIHPTNIGHQAISNMFLSVISE